MGMADRGPTHVYNDFSFWLELLYITYAHIRPHTGSVFHPHFICSKKNLRMMPQSCNLRSAVEEWLGACCRTSGGRSRVSRAVSSLHRFTNDALAVGGCIINRSSAKEASDQDRTGAPRPAAHALAAAPAATSIRDSSLAVRPALTRRHRQPDPEQHAPRTTRLQRSLTPRDPRRSLLRHDTARP